MDPNDWRSWLQLWLLDRLARVRRQRPGGRLRLLDFGGRCGESAPKLLDIDGVDGHAYDLPAGEGDRPADFAASLRDTFGAAARFDVILSVAALMDLPVDPARAAIASMLDCLAPGEGRLVLVENPCTAISSRASLRPGGRWRHALARYVDGKADMEIFDRFPGERAIYCVTPHEAPRQSRFFYRETPDADPAPLDCAGVLARGLARAARDAERLNAEILGVRPHDPEPRDGGDQAVQDELRRLRQDKARLETELAATRARFADRQKLLEDIGLALTAARKSTAPAPETRGAGDGQAPCCDAVLWNHRRDTLYAHDLPDMQRVLHVFHQEWVGVRAAVGSLGGQKLAIAAHRPLSDAELIQICATIAGADFLRLVFHALSENALKLISALHRRGLGDRLYLVKHGSPEQWVYAPERDMALAAIDLLRHGVIRTLHVMKRGFDCPVDGLFRPILFNMAPHLAEPFPLKGAEALRLPGVAFSAGWSNWRKNVHTNLLGAALSENITAVWHHADDVRLPEPLNAKLVHKTPAAREDTFHLMALASLSLNVSITDCHPMVNIESQALGRPCLRGDLHLDALEDHPYVELTMVRDASSVIGITRAVDRILAMPADERREITLDYQAQNDRISRARYREFLEI